MKLNFKSILHLAPRKLFLGVLLGTSLLPQLSPAQFFSGYNQYGDMLACFRRPSSPSYELVVDIGNINTFERLSVGAVTNIGNFSTNQLRDAHASFNSLQWSVLAAFPLSAAWSNFPAATVWFTVPRPDAASQSAPPVRGSVNINQQVRNNILSIGHGAQTISTQLGATNADNNALLVREPVGPNDPNSLYSLYNYSAFVSGPNSIQSGNADFNGQFSFTVENTAPAAFISAIVSDLYRACPSGKTDPGNGQTSGNAVYLGYFTLNPNGTMIFTRAVGASSSNPPPPPVLAISSSFNAGVTSSTITFGTTNGATYTLHFTNSSGLGSPVSSWPVSATTVSGDGANHFFLDSTTDSSRFYRVSAR